MRTHSIRFRDSVRKIFIAGHPSLKLYNPRIIRCIIWRKRGTFRYEENSDIFTRMQYKRLLEIKKKCKFKSSGYKNEKFA